MAADRDDGDDGIALVEPVAFASPPWVLVGAPEAVAVPDALRAACAGATYLWLAARGFGFPIPRVGARDGDPCFGDVEWRGVEIIPPDPGGAAVSGLHYLQVRASADAWRALTRLVSDHEAGGPARLVGLTHVSVYRGGAPGGDRDVLLAQWRLGARRPLRLAPAVPAAAVHACARALRLAVEPPAGAAGEPDATDPKSE